MPDPENTSDDASPVDGGDAWTFAYLARDTLEANLVVSRLQDQGLHARVDFENVAALGLLGSASAGGGPGGAKVQVQRSELPAARAILDQIESDRAARRAKREVRCPMCGSGGATRKLNPIRYVAWAMLMLLVAAPAISGAFDRQLSGWWFVLLPMGLALLVWRATPHWRCVRCGHRWAQGEPEDLEEDEGGENDDEKEKDEN
jgi:DNA-directed RNA polymerase subunit RPC12/RpoP